MLINKTKELIKLYLRNKGLLIIEEEKYQSVIKGTEELYRKTILKNLPKYKKERINLMYKLLGTEIHEAFYLINYLHKSLSVNGDVCEFGVAQGRTSALIAHEIMDTDKSLWLFDSFQGLPKPSKKDKLKNDIFKLGKMESYEGTMACPISLVKNQLNKIKFPFKRVNIVPGFIEKTIKSENIPHNVCFAYIDFDFYKPTLITLNFLDKVLSKNGVIIVDDFDYFSTGIKTAVTEFLSSPEKKDKYKLSVPNKYAGAFCIIQKIK